MPGTARRFKRRAARAAAFLFALLLLLAGCASNEEAPDEDASARVFLIAENEKHRSVAVLAGTAKKGELTKVPYATPTDLLAEGGPVVFSDDLELYIKGVTVARTLYSLYREGGEAEYEGGEDFYGPAARGNYVLVVEAAFGTQDDYELYRHYFRLIKE